MNIAVLGWGSLIWDPRELATSGEWQADGPVLPIEFARVSANGRLTLVIVPGAQLVTTCWARSSLSSLPDAIKNLCVREETVERHIGSLREGDVRAGTMPAQLVASINTWRQRQGLDAVIWTNLPEKFSEVTGQPFTPENAVAYLKSLESDARAKAEEYFRRAPAQVQTPVRQVVEAQLGWSHEGSM